MGHRFKLVKPIEIDKHKADIRIDGWDLKDTVEELGNLLSNLDEEDYPYLTGLYNELGIISFNRDLKEENFKKQLEQEKQRV